MFVLALGALDIAILAAVGAWLVFVVAFVIYRRAKGKNMCGGCDGCCENCRKKCDGKDK